MASKITFIYNNPVDTATLTESSQVATLPVENIQTADRNEKWRTTDHVSESVIIHTPNLDPMNALVIVNHNLSPTAQIRIQANSSNSFGGTTPVDITIDALEGVVGAGDDAVGEYPAGGVYVITDDRIQPPIVRFLDTVLGADCGLYEYKKVTITDPDNADGYIEIGRLFLAPYTEMEVNLDKGATLRYRDESKAERAESGKRYVDEKQIYAEVTFGIKNVTTAERNLKLLKIWQAVGIRKPFVVVLDPKTPEGRYFTAFYGCFVSEMTFQQSSYFRHALQSLTFQEDL